MDGSRTTIENEQLLAIIGDGVCVLVVKNNSSVAEFAFQALRELCYSTVLALNAAEALAELKKDCDRFHIVFLKRPHSDGVMGRR